MTIGRRGVSSKASGGITNINIESKMLLENKIINVKGEVKDKVKGDNRIKGGRKGVGYEIQTPKGLYATRNIGTHLSYFIANYKGGRNESFMYGVDENTH